MESQNINDVYEAAICAANVSIPFKREGTWKVCWIVLSFRDLEECFNSLQTGRYMESKRDELILYVQGQLEFQFPSNGKVHGKMAGNRNGF